MMDFNSSNNELFHQDFFLDPDLNPSISNRRLHRSPSASSSSSAELLDKDSTTLMSSSESKSRVPTFKDYGDQIRALEQENFQLKLRIYLQGNSVPGGGSGIGKLPFDPGSDFYSGYSQTISTGSQCALLSDTLEEEKSYKAKYQQLCSDYKNLEENVERLTQEKSELLSKVYALEEMDNNTTEFLKKEVHELKRKLQEQFSNQFTLEQNLQFQLQTSEGLKRENQLLIERAHVASTAISTGCQCSLLSHPTEEEEAYKAKYQRLCKDNKKLEENINRLTKEKAGLVSKVYTLEELDYNSTQPLKKKIQELKLKLQEQFSNQYVLERNLLCQLKTSEDVKRENQALVERAHVAENALQRMHGDYAKLTDKLKSLNSVVPFSENYKRYISAMGNDTRQDLSPDLGIESGQDGGRSSENVSPRDVNLNLIEENKKLRLSNKELAIKLKDLKNALYSTSERLERTELQKREVERAVCRQLHRTHTILRKAKDDMTQTNGDTASV